MRICLGSRVNGADDEEAPKPNRVKIVFTVELEFDVENPLSYSTDVDDMLVCVSHLFEIYKPKLYVPIRDPSQQ